MHCGAQVVGETEHGQLLVVAAPAWAAGTREDRDRERGAGQGQGGWPVCLEVYAARKMWSMAGAVGPRGVDLEAHRRARLERERAEEEERGENVARERRRVQVERLGLAVGARPGRELSCARGERRLDGAVRVALVQLFAEVNRHQVGPEQGADEPLVPSEVGADEGTGLRTRARDQGGAAAVRGLRRLERDLEGAHVGAKDVEPVAELLAGSKSRGPHAHRRW